MKNHFNIQSRTRKILQLVKNSRKAMGDSEKRAVLLPVDDAETDDDQWEYYDDSTTLCDFWQVCILSLRHYCSWQNILITLFVTFPNIHNDCYL